MSTGHHRRMRSVWRACFCNADGTLHPAGKEALANLRDAFKLDHSPFSSDPLRMACRVGQHEVIRHILRWIELTDEQVFALDSTPEDEGSIFNAN
jgi:hypothetical protein